MTEQRKCILKRKLQESRFRLMHINKEFALPLNDITFVAVKNVYRITTNGKCIFFDPDWLSKLDKTAIDFILSHQLMHIALGHILRPTFYKGDRFHLACDIVANSNLERLGWRYDSIKGVGKIYYETFFPAETGITLTSLQALEKIPFDPATMTETKRRRYMIDSDEGWGKNDDCFERGIVILSPYDEEPEDLVCDETIGGDHFFVKTEYYEKKPEQTNDDNDNNGAENEGGQNIVYAIKELRKMISRENSTEAERYTRINHYSKLDWRKLLNSCISDEAMDYSFLPPDRRFYDTDFFMPDFNERSEETKEILFWIDTSGSVEDETLSSVYGEIYNAVMQFDGKLMGWLGFFDTQVTYPIPFCSVEELRRIVPRGGGGTDFDCVFRYMKLHMAYEKFSSVVIFTDGQGEFPKEPDLKETQVLWLFSDRGVVAPWGKWAYVDVK